MMLQVLNQASGTVKLMVVVAQIIIGIVLYFTVPNILPKSSEQKYEIDRKLITTKVNVYLAGYPPKVVNQRQSYDSVTLGIHPNYALANGGIANNLKLSDVGNDVITTLGTLESNPTSGKEQSATPSWVDGDGNGERAPGELPLYHGDVSANLNIDHWTTTVVNVKNTEYVVDSRDWFIDMDMLLKRGYFTEIPASASLDNSVSGTGSYSWYIDEDGKVKSMLFRNPKPETDGFQNVYP